MAGGGGSRQRRSPTPLSCLVCDPMLPSPASCPRRYSHEMAVPTSATLMKPTPAGSSSLHRFLNWSKFSGVTCAARRRRRLSERRRATLLHTACCLAPPHTHCSSPQPATASQPARRQYDQNTRPAASRRLTCGGSWFRVYASTTTASTMLSSRKEQTIMKGTQ